MWRNRNLCWRLPTCCTCCTCCLSVDDVHMCWPSFLSFFSLLVNTPRHFFMKEYHKSLQAYEQGRAEQRSNHKFLAVNHACHAPVLGTGFWPISWYHCRDQNTKQIEKTSSCCWCLATHPVHWDAKFMLALGNLDHRLGLKLDPENQDTGLGTKVDSPFVTL